MSGFEPERIRLDRRLSDLVRNIANGADLDERVRAKLLPPSLLVRRIDRGLNLFRIASPKGQAATILVGGECYDYVHNFTAAAATYFLATTPDGKRPSEQWAAAREALVTTLHWASSPTRSALPFPTFPLTERQRHAAHVIGDYTFRFAVVHELAHVALDHEGVGVMTSPLTAAEEEPILQQSQQSELEADAVGLELHLATLPDPTHVVTALASGMYFLNANHLFDGRLMLLGRLVDHDRWKIRLTHPPYIHRSLNLLQAALELAGTNAVGGLERLHGDLWNLVSAIWDAANQRKDKASAYVAKRLKEGRPTPSTTRKILQQFEACPIGVIEGLAVAGSDGRPSLVEDVLVELPEEFRTFVNMSRAARVDAILGA
jgi:hypothetical protein